MYSREEQRNLSKAKEMEKKKEKKTKMFHQL